MTIEELLARAKSAGIGAHGLIALPCANQQPGLQGFLNKSDSHQHGCFARAIIESVSATSEDLVDHLYPDNKPPAIIATGGGARSDLWLQIQADLLDTEIIRTRCGEPACMGAALLASSAAGWFEDVEHAGRKWIQSQKRFTPDQDRHNEYRLWRRRYLQAVT